MSLPTARFIKGGFKVSQHKVYLVKIGKLKIVWSRELPAIQSSVTPNQRFRKKIKIPTLGTFRLKEVIPNKLCFSDLYYI